MLVTQQAIANELTIVKEYNNLGLYTKDEYEDRLSKLMDAIRRNS